MNPKQNLIGANARLHEKAPTPPHIWRYATMESPVPLLTTEGPKHVVVYANPAFCRLSGLNEADLVGNSLPESMQAEHSDLCSALLDRVYLTGITEALSDQERSADEHFPSYWSYTAWAVLDEEEHPIGVMLQVSDTTEATRFQYQAARINGELLASSLRQHEMTEATNRLNELLEVHATLDGLTGLRNHRTFQERLRDEVDRSVRHNSPLSVMLLDVDHFKQYNDLYGHLTGDAILRQIGEILIGAARHTDLVARYGGEEFAVILTETDAEGAKVLAERFRNAIETAPWSGRPVTVSVGVNTYSPSARDAVSLIAGADKALYRSKRGGRNCVTSATEPIVDSQAASEMARPLEAMMLEMRDGHNNLLMTGLTTDRDRLKNLMVESWSKLIGLRDRETLNHSERVTELMARFTQAMGMNEETIQHARWGALLHDVGKIGVPDSILQKPGPLTEDEWTVMKRHTSLAYDMLSPFPFLVGQALDIAHYHHERWSGAGYPNGLRGEDIPMPARMFAIVDVYDALRSDRPYRNAWTEEKTREFLHTESGSQFEPRLVEIFLNMLIQPIPAA